jgi:hypothetical protein
MFLNISDIEALFCLQELFGLDTLHKFSWVKVGNTVEHKTQNNLFENFHFLCTVAYRAEWELQRKLILHIVTSKLSSAK